MANQIRTIGLRQIVPDGQITSDFQKSCQAPFAKIFSFAFGPNQFTDSHCLVPARGADRASSRNAGRDAVDAAASGEQVRAGRMALMRTAKSCGSDAPMPASSLRSEAQATVSKKQGHRGEHEVSRKTIARGMPGRSGVTVVTTLMCLFYCTRGCGRIERPAFPAPSEFQKAGRSWQTSREACGEIGKPCLGNATAGTQAIIHGVQVLTFAIPIAISTPPGTSGLLAFALEP